MSISAPFIKRPIATSLLMVALLLSGLLAYQFLPVSALPEVEYPTIQVVTFYPGASPQVMSTFVTAPLEKQFGQMPGLNSMTSTSSMGASVINLTFSLNLSLDVAEQEVQAAINTALNFLPNDLPNLPVYNKVNPADTPVITLALTSNNLPLFKVQDLADTRLAQRIAELRGVGLVSLAGGQRPAVRIQANPLALSAYGLSLETVRNIVNLSNVNGAKGSFDGPRLAYTINANDRLLKSADYEPIIIHYQNNAPVRLSDVARVVDSAENVLQAAWMNQTPAIIMNIQKQPGANVLSVADSIKQLLQKMSETLPKGINIHLLSDRTTTIRASYEAVQFDLVFAICLVILVIFLFLRHFAATIIPAIAIPLSLISTFGVMYFFGFSLNNLTLMSLTIATGLVADDAIVMIENISRYIEAGEPPIQAALKGSAQIAFTIISLTVSLIAVLIPLLFMSDVMGRLFREFAVTLAFTILISAVISLTLTPMLCAYLLKSQIEERPQSRILKGYASSLRWVLNHQGLTLLIALITLVLTIGVFTTIPKGFFPPQDTGAIQGITVASQSTSFAAMSQQQQALAKVVLQDPAVDNIASFIGIDGTNTTLNSGRMMITLKPLDARYASATDIINRLQQEISKQKNMSDIKLYMQPVQDLTVDTQISRTQYQYSISSPDADAVTKWNDRILQALSSSPYLNDLNSNLQNRGLETYIEIDRDTAARLGITTQQIDDVLYDAFGQRIISTIYTQSNQYRVILEMDKQTNPVNQTPQVLQNIYVTTSTGGAVPLSTITRISQRSGPLVVNRQEQFPVANLSFNLAPGAALGDAINIFNTTKQQLNLPDNMQASFQGAARIFEGSLANEGLLILAAAMVVYIVLGVLYESYIHPITILSTLPSATFGALLALWLTHQVLSVIALIGVILLIGIVMKNAIMMIDFALEQERVYNKSAPDAIYEAALLRFRPIIMTTLASFLGAVPLAIGSGMGSELRQPLGITIIGGLIVSQLLTLYTTPVIYLAFDRVLQQFDWLKKDNTLQEDQ